MRSSTSWKRAATVGPVVALVLGALLGNAHADPITPAYTVTDLGPASFMDGPNLSTIANGQQVVIAANGHTAYPFQPVHDANFAYDSTIPVVPVAPPNPSGDPTAPFTYIGDGIENANGIVVMGSLSSVGMEGHYVYSTAYYVTRNADGSWGHGMTMWNGAPSFEDGGNTQFSIIGINNRNQALGMMAGNPSNFAYYGPGDVALYDIDTNHLVNLTNYLETLPNSPYSDPIAVALDQQGRILLNVEVSGVDEDTLLLTPDGVSSAPIDLEAPEPTSIAVLALAMAALAHRQWRARRVR